MKKLEDTGERLIAKGNEQTLTYGEHLSRYLSVRGLVKEKVVLDVASGTGYGTAMISDAGAKRVYGLDYSEDAIEYSRQNYHRRNIEFLVGDAHNLPYENDSIDVVISLETIEHLLDPKKFVSEVKRVLRKDGVFVVSTPNDDEFMEGNEFHVHEFQLTELKKLIKHNFKSSNFYFQGSYFTAALQSEKQFTEPYQYLAYTAKTFTQKKEKAIYFIAIASNSTELPVLEENVVMADRWNMKEDIQRNAERNRQTLELRSHIETLETINDALKQELKVVYASTSWRLTKWLRKVGIVFSRRQ